MSKRKQSLETLRETHSFPCDFEFKVIGDNSEQFIARVAQVGVNVLGSEAEPDVSTRESSESKYVSVSMTLEVGDAESILEIYEGVQELEGVRLVL